MAYYEGDYYQGDYYEGDPFLGALFGSGIAWLGKKLLGRGAKKTTQAIATAGAGAATGLAVGSVGGAAVAPIWQAMKKVAPMITTIPMPGGGVFRPTRILPGGVPATSPGCCPTGYHFNKSESRARATMGAPPGSICIKNRSMNVANPRALRRGLRRVAGFGKLAMRAKKDIRRAAKSIGA